MSDEQVTEKEPVAEDDNAAAPGEEAEEPAENANQDGQEEDSKEDV